MGNTHQMGEWIRRKIASQYPVQFGGFHKAFRQKLFSDFKKHGPMVDGDDEVIEQCDFYSLDDMFGRFTESKEWYDDYKFYTSHHYRPSCWFYSEDDNPSLPGRKVATFHWIEMRYPESQHKRQFLANLKDWTDGIQCEKTGRWADLRVYVFDASEEDLEEIDPIKWFYENLQEKLYARL